MSKLLVNQIVARATADINRSTKEASMPENLRRIQDAFRNSTALAGREDLAEIVMLLTGFRPRTSNVKVAPFEVFAVMSKAEQRVVKFAICMANANGNSYGCSGMTEGNLCYDANTCRLATEEEATKFIAEEVATWEDSAVLNWINLKLGAAYYPAFFAELERQAPKTVSSK